MRHLAIAILLTAVALSSSALQHVLPRAAASRFCRLLVEDGSGNVSSLSTFIHRQMTPHGDADSLSVEQQFCTYVFDYGGWQSLRIFPHRGTDGIIRWYAPADPLPADMDSEHQKYIREVLPRLSHEIEAGHWDNVDGFIDKLLLYQITFASTEKAARPSPVPVIALILLLLLIAIGIGVFSKKR